MKNYKTFLFSKSKLFSVANLIGLLLFVFILTAYADTQRIIEYQYDGAGNITSVRSANNLNPPVVSDLTPNSIRISSTITVIATGTDLAGANITTDHPGLTIGNISSNNTTVTFEISASSDVPLGQRLITFSNRFGSDTAQLEALPEFINVDVSPLVSPVLSVNLQESNSGTTSISPLVSPVLSLLKGSDSSVESEVSPVVSPVLSLLKGSSQSTINSVNPLVSPVLSVNKE